MYPIGLCDIIEIHQLPSGDEPIHFSQSGIRFESDLEKNLCIKAWKLVSGEGSLPPIAIHLHKQIPVGAGLGGGSSNGSSIIKGLNPLLSAPLSHKRMAELAGQLGSDCPFFLHEGPMLMEGRGEVLSPSQISLDRLYLALLFPDIAISTAEAYGGLTPAYPESHLGELLDLPIDRWSSLIINDFEKSIFSSHPLLKVLKDELYRAGAIYASMSGSGSSLFGIFKSPPKLPESIRKYVIWTGLA